MLGAFKDFSKSASDLNKRDFYDEKSKHKATIKTKSADGVSFEGFITAKSTSELNLNFKDSELELKNKIAQDATYTVDATLFKVADGVDLKATFVTPDSTGKDAFFKSVTVGGEYKTSDINSNAGVELAFADNAAFSVNGWKFNSAGAFKAADDLTVGGSIAGATVESSEKDGKSTSAFVIPGIVVGTAFKTGDIQLACNINASLASGFSLQPGSVSGSLFQQATSETAVAAELSFGHPTISKGEKKGWVDSNSELKWCAKLGTSYKLSDCATLKSRLSLADTPALDFAWVQSLGKGSVTFAQSIDESSSFTYGISYTLDA
eukprot:TRINITY_DN2692_c0_g1_i1.p1 TRINITY_DN2692_c0_g1~~TRINITY_DN2692_c0_g1_i1.p1  ORF type:complete len:321 (-),score=122.62 TRINITY_DN2692_c0_g1_i1:263-1225(-)